MIPRHRISRNLRKAITGDFLKLEDIHAAFLLPEVTPADQQTIRALLNGDFTNDSLKSRIFEIADKIDKSPKIRVKFTATGVMEVDREEFDQCTPEQVENLAQNIFLHAVGNVTYNKLDLKYQSMEIIDKITD